MKSRDRNDRAGVPILSTCRRDLRRPKFANSCPAEAKLLLDRRSLKPLSLGFQGIVGAEVAPENGPVCRNKNRVSPSRQSFPLPKASKPRKQRNPDCLGPLGASDRCCRSQHGSSAPINGQPG